MITVWPYGIDETDWFDNLIIDYPKENLPILRDPEEWQKIGSIIASTGVFAERGCPSPVKIDESGKHENYEDWQEWAKEVYSVMIVYNLDENRKKNE